MIEPASAPRYVQSPALVYLQSLSVDRALAPYDVAGSIAHAEMLGETGIIPPSEAHELARGLREIAAEIEAGSFPWRPELEDVHTNVEVRLTELLGAIGGKLHTARSRNDQIALDERLYLRAAVASVAHDLVRLEETLLARARPEIETLLPGYTHLQRAQPVSLAHHLLAHFWRFERDIDRLLATARRSDVSPLGAGALAGSTLPIDPARVAQQLGFSRSFENSLDAVSDRDFLAELLFDLALVAIHLSSLGEELVLWATAEFGFLRPGPILGSGSSLMPQKRNPDVAELARGKSGRALGDLVALLTTLKGLPLAYDRDLQEDKPPVLDAVANVGSTVREMIKVLAGAEFDRDRMAASASDSGLRATDLAEHLVRGGMPFRAAHEAVGKYVGSTGGSVDVGSALRWWPEAGQGLPEALDPRNLLVRRASPGGPSPPAVRAQISLAEARLGAAVRSLSSLDRQAGIVEELCKERKK